MDRELGPTIAERLLLCKGGERKELTVRLGTPKKAKQMDWVCPYQIVGLGESRIEAAYGLDGVQALVMGLEAIRVRLEQAGMHCTWPGGEDGDHGFPRFVPIYFGARFASGIGRLIDRELKRFGDSLQPKRRATRRRTRGSPDSSRKRRT